MILNLERVFFAFSNFKPQFLFSFEVNPIKDSEDYIYKTVSIVNNIAKKYSDKIEIFHNLWSFTISYDLEFLPFFLIYLILELKITIKIGDKNINTDQSINGMIDEIQFLVLEFYKKEIIQINNAKIMGKEVLHDLEDEVIFLK